MVVVAAFATPRRIGAPPSAAISATLAANKVGRQPGQPISFKSSALLAERRLAVLVGHRKGDFRHLFADLIHHRIDLAPYHQIV